MISDRRMDDLAGSNVQVWPVIMLVPLMRWWPRWWRRCAGSWPGRGLRWRGRRLRTLTGIRQFCAIRSHLSSAAKHGTGFFDALIMLTKGEPWMPAST